MKIFYNLPDKTNPANIRSKIAKVLSNLKLKNGDTPFAGIKTGVPVVRPEKPLVSAYLLRIDGDTIHLPQGWLPRNVVHSNMASLMEAFSYANDLKGPYGVSITLIPADTKGIASPRVSFNWAKKGRVDQNYNEFYKKVESDYLHRKVKNREAKKDILQDKESSLKVIRIRFQDKGYPDYNLRIVYISNSLIFTGFTWYDNKNESQKNEKQAIIMDILRQLNR